MGQKKIKYLEEYVEELCEIFPQIDEKEMLRIITDMSTLVTRYIGNRIVGLRITSTTNLLNKNKRQRFIITRVINKGCKSMLIGARKSYKKRQKEKKKSDG